MTQVLIVGAGPTGLVLAARLRRLGVSFRIVDRHPDVLELTKAAAVHARALENLRDVGVAEPLVAEGTRVDVLTLRTGYRDRVAVDFRVLGDTAYPHMVDVPQSRTEHRLLEHLAEAGVAVERGVTVTGLEQHPDRVVGHVTDPDGRPGTIEADWVVGADGSRSAVRAALGLDFDGDEYADDWVLCDAVVRWPLPRNEMTFSGDDEGIFGVFPLPGERRYRLAYTQTRDASGALVEPDLADAQRAMTRTGIDGTIASAEQFWTFRLSHRLASRFRSGRVFLAGDAGHVHTPFGGQGMNLGVGDATNLAWKLADVCAGRAPSALLDSYEAERRSVAEQVVAVTHLGASAMLLRRDRRRHARDAAFAAIQSAAPARRLAARRLSQLSHTYRGTAAVTGTPGRVRAGDRLPDLVVHDGLRGEGVRLHDATSPDRHTALVVTTSPEAVSAAALAAELRRRWRVDLDTLVVTADWRAAGRLHGREPVLLDRGRDAGALYGMPGGPLGPSARAYLVRPDRHVGYAGPASLPSIAPYLNAVALAAPDAPSPDTPYERALEVPR